jgi:hypothetical protein
MESRIKERSRSQLAFMTFMPIVTREKLLSIT